MHVFINWSQKKCEDQRSIHVTSTWTIEHSTWTQKKKAHEKQRKFGINRASEPFQLFQYGTSTHSHTLQAIPIQFQHSNCIETVRNGFDRVMIFRCDVKMGAPQKKNEQNKIKRATALDKPIGNN